MFRWYLELSEKHDALLRDWNKFVPDFNEAVAPRPRGRRLEVSESQVADVLRRRKTGDSLRNIAAATGLDLRTVRSIMGGKQRTAGLRKREFDKHRAREFRARKRLADMAAKQTTEEHRAVDDLIKTAKGLDSR